MNLVFVGRKLSLKMLLAGYGLCILVIVAEGYAAQQPVIIDTDLGTQMDDSFAIGFALQSSEYIDVKLVVTCTDDTTARAKILAKQLTIAGRDDVPIGIGLANSNKTGHPLWDWAKDFELSNYKGGVFENGIDQMAKIILESDTVVTIMAIGPMTNFPLLLQKYPEVVKKARIRAMAGSIYRGYDNSTTPTDEYNVRTCPQCMRDLLQAGWNITITPLDTCGITYLTPAYSQPFIASSSSWSFALGSSLLYFCTNLNCSLDVSTRAVWDSVGTLLTLPKADDFLVFKRLNLTVTDDGYTIIDDSGGTPTEVALYWKDNGGLDSFREYFISVLSRKAAKCNVLDESNI